MRAPPGGVGRLSPKPRSCLLALLAVTASLLLGACGATGMSTRPTSGPPTTTSRSASPSPATPLPATPSTNTTGFAFTADAVVGYYQSQGYACTATRPSTKAAGFTVRTCQLIDGAGRTRVVGVVTDPGGGLADGFASVQGTATETFLAPTDALEPLAGFLGAMLGETQGALLLTWLAGHLGDSYAETTLGAIKVATYTDSPESHTTLYVELANAVFLSSPGPSGRFISP
jgi:hypothetical protein